MAITLKAARINAGLTQLEAAQMLVISKDTLSKWERGITFPSADKIPLIEKIYHTTYDNLIFLPQ